MRLISFEDGDRTGYGAVIGQEVARLDCDPKLPTLKSYLARYHGVLPAPESEIHLPLAGLQLLPPIPDPSKIFCVATNYPTPAIREAGPPAFPLLFTRIAEAQVGGDRDLIKPDVSDRYDFEGELAVVIGLAGRHIPADTAMSHVAGYACFNEGSVRDWQKHSSQFTPGKNFAKSGSFGPWLVTVDEVPDPRDLVLTTRVNGQIMQYGEV
ncbi:MAG: FAA hydrolase family protein, partial [Lysobacteraceae bacterium]